MAIVVSTPTTQASTCLYINRISWLNKPTFWFVLFVLAVVRAYFFYHTTWQLVQPVRFL